MIIKYLNVTSLISNKLKILLISIIINEDT